MLKKLFGNICTGIDKTISWLGSIGCWVALITTLVLTINVLGRFIFNKPLLGCIEIVELTMVIISALSIPYAAIKRAHVRVDLIIARLSRRNQIILDIVAFSLSAIISGLMFYQAAINFIYYAQHLYERTDLLSIPYVLPRLILAVGFLLLCLRTLTDVFRHDPVQQPLPPEKIEEKAA